MIQSVDRAIRILSALQGARHLSLSEIAAKLELPASTVHGLAKTLGVHGMIEQEPDSGRYRLGPAVLRLGNVYLDTLELRARTMTWSEALARRTGYAVRTGVPMGAEVIIIQHEPRPDGSRQMPEVGIVIPAHACALGKVLLAYRPGDATGTISEGELRAMTGETIVEPQKLKKELEAVVATALATECDEAVLGESGIAAPVFDAAGRNIGAIGVVVPTTDWPVADTATDALREAARNISRELGSPRWPVAPVPAS
jgi:DNA-binding IclR family transcriptional regulator